VSECTVFPHHISGLASRVILSLQHCFPVSDRFPVAFHHGTARRLQMNDTRLSVDCAVQRGSSGRFWSATPTSPAWKDKWESDPSHRAVPQWRMKCRTQTPCRCNDEPVPSLLPGEAGRNRIAPEFKQDGSGVGVVTPSVIGKEYRPTTIRYFRRSKEA